MSQQRINNRSTLTLVLTFVQLVNSEFKLDILHTNDLHSRFEETNAHSGQCRGDQCYGGFARLKAAVDEMRQEARDEGRHSVFLNAGDIYQGSILYTMFKWQVVADLTNMLGFDVLSLGNHEFDDGPAVLAPFLINTTTPVVCCNIDFSEEPVLSQARSLKLKPSVVLDIDGVKVGVVGYLTPDTKFLADTGNVKLSDEVTEIKKEAERLREDGVKIIIALGHSGYTKDKLIAQQVADVDVVVGGHTNTFLYSGKEPDIEKSEGPYPTVVEQPSGRKVYVVQAYAYTKYLGRLRLTFDNNGEVVESQGNPVLINSTFMKDDAVEKAVQKYKDQVDAKTGRKVGVSKVFLEGDQMWCRTRECNFGNFATDAFVHRNTKDHVGDGWTDAPVSFIQGGAFRASIEPKLSEGQVRFADLLLTFPFTNSIERLTLKGSILRDVLEKSVAKYSLEEKVGGFLQYSGIHVVYDLSRPPFHRVVSVMVRCGEDCNVPKYLPLDPNKTYNVLTITYLADGGDDFTELQKATERKTLSFSEVEAIELYFEALSPIHPELEGRIELQGHVQVPNIATSVLTCNAILLVLSIIVNLLWY